MLEVVMERLRWYCTCHNRPQWDYFWEGEKKWKWQSTQVCQIARGSKTTAKISSASFFPPDFINIFYSRQSENIVHSHRFVLLSTLFHTTSCHTGWVFALEDFPENPVEKPYTVKTGENIRSDSFSLLSSKSNSTQSRMQYIINNFIKLQKKEANKREKWFILFIHACLAKQLASFYHFIWYLHCMTLELMIEHVSP